MPHLRGSPAHAGALAPAGCSRCPSSQQVSADSIRACAEPSDTSFPRSWPHLSPTKPAKQPPNAVPPKNYTGAVRSGECCCQCSNWSCSIEGASTAGARLSGSGTAPKMTEHGQPLRTGRACQGHQDACSRVRHAYQLKIQGQKDKRVPGRGAQDALHATAGWGSPSATVHQYGAVRQIQGAGTAALPQQQEPSEQVQGIWPDAYMQRGRAEGARLQDDDHERGHSAHAHGLPKQLPGALHLGGACCQRPWPVLQTQGLRRGAR